MEQIKIIDVLEATGGNFDNSQLTTHNSQLIKGVSIDSRTIKSDELFVAIKGSRNDGHSFVGDAVKKGAVCAIVNKFQNVILSPDITVGVNSAKNLFPNSISPIPIIAVDDTIKALGDLSCWYRSRFSIPIIGITGSNGKTTTKELIAKCLGIRYRVCKSPCSFNSLTGVPLSLFNLSTNHEVCVLEIGANRVGEIARLAKIVKPKFAVITNIAPTHLENFKTIEGVLDEKLNLARAAELPILNADDPFLSRVQMKAFRFGIKKGDLRAEFIEQNNGVQFKAKDVLFELPLLGIYQVYNALAALSVGIHFDLKLSEMSKTLKEVPPVPHREQIIELNTIKIIDSTYNANPVSMELALHELGKYKDARRVAILGDMLELGDNAYDFHIRIGKLLNGLGIDVLIGYGELARGYVECGEVSEKFYFDEMDLLKEELKNIIKPGDVILIKGSRAMKMEEIVGMISNRAYNK